MNNMNKTQYKILTAKTIEDIEKMTIKHVEDGWQPAGPVTEIHCVKNDDSDHFYHEMVRFVVNDEERQRAEMQIAADRQAFMEKLEKMDSKVKELLELNGIELMFVDGKLYTKANDKVSEGINPQDVLKKLKSSDHYPIDMPDETVINAIESII